MDADDEEEDSTSTDVPVVLHPPFASKPSDIVALREYMIDQLNGLKIADLGIKNTPIVLSSALTPKQALNELIKRHIRSAPVVDAGKFVGVLDIRDFLKHAVSQHREEHARQHHASDESITDDSGSAASDDAAHTPERHRDSAWDALHIMAHSPHVATNTLVYLARMRRFWGINEHESVFAAMRMMSCGPHILGVLNDAGELTTILSQGMLFAEISKRWTTLPCDISAKELVSMGIATTPVVCVGYNAAAHTVFELMAERGLSGVAIVDDDGKLVHNTSATDIKLWTLSSHSLDATIEDFLCEIRKHSSPRKVLFPVSSITEVEEHDGFQRLINKLRVTKYHRMWIVDAKHRPDGVVAISDVFKFVAGEAKPERRESMSASDSPMKTAKSSKSSK
jgi:CBS domain-containing protein